MQDFIGIGIFLVAAVIVIICMAIWIYSLVDVIKGEFRGENDKLIWILVIVIGGILGSIIYFLFGRKNKI